MIRIYTFVVILSFFAYSSNSCSDKINDIHIFLSNIQDSGVIMEASLRTQYNTFHGERVKTIGTLLNTLKTLQDQMPSDLCKYESAEIGLNIMHAMNDFINIVRKNVLYSVKSSMEDMKIDQSNILYDFVMYINDFIDKIGIGSKNLFNEGKGCVMGMETEVKSFIDMSSKKFMECLRNASISNPISPPKFKTYTDALGLTVRTMVYYLRLPFYYIWAYSTQQQNDTAAESFITYTQSLFPTILDMGKQISQSGLEIVTSLEANNNAFKTCFSRVNATLIDSKRHELINKVNDVCSKA